MNQENHPQTLKTLWAMLVLTLLWVAPLAAEEPAPAAAQPQPSVSVKTSTGAQCNVFTFDATESYAPDNQQITYAWDFGDGTTSDQAVVSHTYVQSGKYTVKLSVTSTNAGKCNTAYSAQVINVNIPPKAIYTAPDAVCVNEEIKLDGNASTSPDPTSKLTYWWDFGDGSQKEGATAVKSYPHGGNYDLGLIVDDNAKSGCSTDRLQKTIKVNEPPVANAGKNIQLNCVQAAKNATVTFDASKSKDINGDTLAYHWDFGDGESAEGPVVPHTYKKNGDYTATVTITDNSGLSCNTATASVSVDISLAPQAVIAGGDRAVCVGEETELDGSASERDPADAVFSNWEFGDSTHEHGLKVKHIYKDPGKYTATLTVENAGDTNCPKESNSVKILVNAPPKVSLKPAQAACIGEEVAFNAEAENAGKLTFFWSFGDGTILKAGPKVTHKFEKGGSYKVSVLVDDGKGSDCSSTSASTIVSINTPPVANAGENTACCANEPTSFNAMQSKDPDGDALSYHWDFGDGTTANDAVTTHNYGKGGKFNIILTVDDNTGTSCSSAKAGFVATINETPVPIIKIK